MFDYLIPKDRWQGLQLGAFVGLWGARLSPGLGAISRRFYFIFILPLFFTFLLSCCAPELPDTARSHWSTTHQRIQLSASAEMASATGSDNNTSSSPNSGNGGNGRDDDSRTNLIINYLPQNLTESELFKMFVTIGTVTNCKIMRDFRVKYFV